MKYCPQCDKDYASGDVCAVHAIPLVTQTPAKDALIGATIHGKYCIDEKVARGGMATVYRGRVLKTGLVVAIKVLHETLQESPEDVKRFLREAKMLGQLNHPHIVSLIDSGQTEGGRIFLVLEYLYGQTIEQLVKQDGALSLPLALGLMAQVLDGVAAAHAAALVHRDLTPANILIAYRPDNTETVKIVDFGIAKLTDGAATLTQSGLTMGTPGYLSPEQIMGESNVDAASDVYALGAVLYYMLAGRRPFDGNSSVAILSKQMHGEPAPLDTAALGLPAALTPILLKAMARQRAERFQSCAELRAALLALSPNVAAEQAVDAGLKLHRRTAGVGDFGAPLAQVAAQARAARRPERLRFAAAALVLVAAVGAGTWLTWAPAPKDRPEVRTEVAAAAPQLKAELVAAAPTPIAPIVVGVTTDRSRPTAQALQAGFMAAIGSVNSEGGVSGRPLELVLLDDAGDAQRARDNATALLEERHAVALLGGSRAETTKAAQQVAKEHDTLLFAPTTGSRYLRGELQRPNAFVLRASLADETAALVDTLGRELRVELSAVGIFAEDSQDGFECAKGVVDAMAKRGRKDSSRTVLARFQSASGDRKTELKNAVRVLSKNARRLRAVVVCSDTEGTAELLRLPEVRKLGLQLAATSRVDAVVLRELLGPDGVGLLAKLVLSQVVPMPDDPAPFLVAFREALVKHAAGEPPSPTALESYVAGRVLAMALKIAGPDAPPVKLVEVFATQLGDIQLGYGRGLSFSERNHEGSQQVWMSMFDASGTHVAFEAPKPAMAQD